MSVTSYRAAAEIIAHDPVAAWTYRVREASALVDHGREFGESTRERAPLQWAMTQNNLGTVLAPLGERESGTARWKELMTALPYGELDYAAGEYWNKEWITSELPKIEAEHKKARIAALDAEGSARTSV